MRKSDVLEEVFGIFADEGLGVVTGDVVPFDAVVVDVLEHREAALPTVIDGLLRVVRLGPLVVASPRPGASRPARVVRVGRKNLGVSSGPEPAVDVDRFEIFARLARVEVTQSP